MGPAFGTEGNRIDYQSCGPVFRSPVQVLGPSEHDSDFGALFCVHKEAGIHNFVPSCFAGPLPWLWLLDLRRLPGLRVPAPHQPYPVG
jgi:hypothetical protein